VASNGGHVAIVLSGVVRLLRRPEWRALAFITIPYIFVVILWPIRLWTDFCCPYCHFLLAIVLDQKGFSLAKINLRAGSWKTNLGRGAMRNLDWLCAFAGWNICSGPPGASRSSKLGQHSGANKKYILDSRAHAGRREIVAYDDILLFLYTRDKLFGHRCCFHPQRIQKCPAVILPILTGTWRS